MPHTHIHLRDIIRGMLKSIGEYTVVLLINLL